MEMMSPGWALVLAVESAQGDPGVHEVPVPVGLTEYVTAAAGAAHKQAIAAMRMRRDFTNGPPRILLRSRGVWGWSARERTWHAIWM
jgi:hypothetical protein